MTSTRTRVALLAALTAATVGGVTAAGPVTGPLAGAVAPAGFGGGRAGFAAAAPVLRADGHDRGDDAGERHERRLRTAHVRTKARAHVHRDGGERRAVAWRERRVTAQVLVARNRATAVARDCTDCSAVAVSVQVVVDGRNDGRVTATNRAVAATVGCTRCSATALAYQFVVAGPGRLRLTRDARDRLRDLRHEMRDVARHGDLADVTAREDALAARVADVLRSGVVDTDAADGTADGTADGAASGPSASFHRAGGRRGGPEVTVRRSHDRA